MNPHISTPFSSTAARLKRSPNSGSSADRAHWAIVGPTGSGKGNYTKAVILEEIEKGHAVTAYWPHADIGESTIAEVYHRLGKRICTRPVLIERASDVDRVIPRIVLQSSSETGLKRMLENDYYLWVFMDMIARRRGLDWTEKPALEECTVLIAKVFQEQDQWWPQWWIPYGLLPGHAVARLFHSHCLNKQLQDEYERMLKRPKSDAAYSLFPASRLQRQTLGSPTIMARTTHPPTVDWLRFNEAGGIHFILGGNVSEDAYRTLVCADFQEQVFVANKAGGFSRPQWIGWDETNNYRLWGNFEIKSLPTVRHLNISMYGQFQNVFNFPEPEMTNEVLSNTNHVWMTQGDPKHADLAALDARGMLDRMKVHHTDKTTRQVHRGFKEVSRILKGKSKHPEHGDLESEREAVNILPLYDEVTEDRPVYETGHEQAFWKAAEIQGMGWDVLVKERHRAPYRMSVPLLPDSWVYEGLAKAKADQCINLIKNRPEYVEPEIRWPETTTSSPTNAMKKSGH